MKLSPIGGAGTATYAPPSTRRTPPPLTDTAAVLGIPADQLTSDMRSGATLSSLADKNGVSASTLLSSVESDLKANAPADSAISSSQLAQMATHMIEGSGQGPHHHASGGPSALSLLVGTAGSAPTDATTTGDATASSAPGLSSMATLLGLSNPQLTSALQSGESLDTLAVAQGVSSSEVRSRIEAELRASAPQGTQDLAGGELERMATDVINGTGSTAPTAVTDGGRASGLDGGAGRISSLGATSSATATNNLNSLANATGLDAGTLLSQLQSGQDLSSLLASAGQTGYGSSVASSINGGVMYDEYV